MARCLASSVAKLLVVDPSGAFATTGAATVSRSAFTAFPASSARWDWTADAITTARMTAAAAAATMEACFLRAASQVAA